MKKGNEYRYKKDDNQKDFNPLVSIVIPVYNGENYLEEAIKSALAQTYKNIEIIVIDDGSKDNTEKIAQKYKQKIRYFKKENGGVASALNLAIEKMNGDYFSWLSHDDLYFDYKIDTQIQYLKKFEDKNIILFSNYILIDEYGKTIGGPVLLNHKLISKKQEYCLLRGFVNGITTLIPKKAFENVGKFDINLRCTQDYDMWYRMIKNYKFIHMKDVLSKTRVHALQDTNNNPKVISEGEILWTKMIEDISDKRKIELEGSIYNYYYKMAIHLKNLPYSKTLKMCIDKCKKIDLEKYNKKSLTDSKTRNFREKIIFCMDCYGPINTVKLIANKILKR